MRAEAVRPKGRWRWVVLAIVVVGAIVVAAVLYYASRPSPGTAVGNPSHTPNPIRSTNSGPTSVAKSPDGCLGGGERTAGMVLAATKDAGNSKVGAVEAAAAFMRFFDQYPYPAPADSNKVQAGAIDKSSSTSDLAAYFATSPDMSGGFVAKGARFYLSTVGGVYQVESYSSGNATVSLGARFVVNDAVSATLESTSTITVRWSDGRWKYVSSGVKRTTDELFGVGQPLVGGC